MRQLDEYTHFMNKFFRNKLGLLLVFLSLCTYTHAKILKVTSTADGPAKHRRSGAAGGQRSLGPGQADGRSSSGTGRRSGSAAKEGCAHRELHRIRDRPLGPYR